MPHHPRRLAALALTLAAVSVCTSLPTGNAEAATTVYYNGAGSAPRISVIGDSTIAALRWTGQFDPLKAFNFVYDAESCRRTVLPSCRGREGYTPDTVLGTMRRLSGQLGTVVAIMGGYDDPGYNFPAAVDAVMAEAARQGVPTVMWLTMRTADVSYVGPGFVSNTYTFRDNNRILLQKAQQYGARLQIADWATYSANHPEWFYADGIHFRAAGATAGATFIAAMAARVIQGHDVTPVPGQLPILPWLAMRGGDRGSSVVNLQRSLIERGYPVFGGVNGVFGASTADAVRRFQAANGLRVTGVVDEMTAIRLGLLNIGGFAAPPPWAELHRGMAGPAVAEAQQALMRNGVFILGGADGGFGSHTRAAVRTFQQRNGLPVTGVIDEATAIKLGIYSGRWRDLRRGAGASRAARAVQQAIVRLGIHLPGGITGTYSTGTYYAVRNFQRLHGLPETGVVDQATAEALGLLWAAERSDVWSSLGLNARGPRVFDAQRALIAAGMLLPGGADGVFGTSTRNAVIAFQRANGLAPSGTIDPRTARALGLLDTTEPTWNRLSIGGVGIDVSAAELALIALGYQASRPDGVFGLDTHLAVLAFQRDRNIPATGQIYPTTARLLGLFGPGDRGVPTVWADLRYGMAGTLVSEAQQALLQNGIANAGRDGVYSSLTRNAVTAFQRQRGLLVTGVIDELTARALGLTSGRWTDLRVGSTVSTARVVQQQLVNLGIHLPGGITGTYSTGTYYAVRNFQRLRGLPETGVVDLATATVLGVWQAPTDSSVWINLSMGDGGQRVADAQRALMAARIVVHGGADGWFSRSMWYSVRNFQRQRGLPDTGVVDIRTARALGLFGTAPSGGWANLAVGSAGSTVLAAEQALAAAGFGGSIGAGNHLYGVGTFTAVQAFQRSRGLPVTGIIDANTARALGLFGGPATAQVMLTALAAESPTTPTSATVPLSTTSTTSTTSSTSTTTSTVAQSSTVPTDESASSESGTSADAESTIGDLVWVDVNADGLQDLGEPGLPDVTVVLLDHTGAELARQMTDELGRYEFTDLPGGTYQLDVDLPDGYGIALPNLGDDEVDSDLSTIDDQLSTARTEPIVVPIEDAGSVDLGLIATTPERGDETASSTEAPQNAESPSSAPPDTEFPTTAAPTTDATVPPTTGPPTTTPPATMPPTTQPPPTSPPVTTAAPVIPASSAG